MTEPTSVACVILAAGAGTRFGGAKMLYELDEGMSILAKTIGIYAPVFDQVHVVVRHDETLLIEVVEREGASCIKNSNAEQGLSQSIVAGVGALASSTSWLFALGDMPYISSATIRALLQRASATSIVVPRSRRGNGNPIIFGADFKHQLLALTGDVGGKALLKSHAKQVQFYACDDHGIHHDIDRVSDIL